MYIYIKRVLDMYALLEIFARKLSYRYTSVTR